MHDQLLPGPRRLPSCGRVDGGREPLVRPARRQRLPGRLPHPPRGDHAPSRRLAGGRSAGAGGVRGAPRLRPLRSPPAGYYEIGEIRRRRGDFAAAEEAYRDGERARAKTHSRVSRCSASPRARSTPRSRASRAASQEVEEPLVAPAALAGAGRDRDRRRRPEDRARGRATSSSSIVDAYKIGGRRAPAFDATVHLARARSRSPRATRTAAVRCLRRGARRMAGGGRAVRDRAGADAARHRVPAPAATSTPRPPSSRPRWRRSSDSVRSSTRSA